MQQRVQEKMKKKTQHEDFITRQCFLEFVQSGPPNTYETTVFDVVYETYIYIELSECIKVDELNRHILTL